MAILSLRTLSRLSIPRFQVFHSSISLRGTRSLVRLVFADGAVRGIHRALRSDLAELVGRFLVWFLHVPRIRVDAVDLRVRWRRVVYAFVVGISGMRGACGACNVNSAARHRDAYLGDNAFSEGEHGVQLVVDSEEWD